MCWCGFLCVLLGVSAVSEIVCVSQVCCAFVRVVVMRAIAVLPDVHMRGQWHQALTAFCRRLTAPAATAGQDTDDNQQCWLSDTFFESLCQAVVTQSHSRSHTCGILC